MYARQIYLYGNGAGIGVNSNGSIHGVENLVISTTGNLTLNTHIRAIDTIDISGADKFINLNQLEASKVIFKDIGYFRNGDDLETLKRPEQLSWMASMGFQNIKAKDINISAREFHNHGKIQADNTLTLNAQQAYNLSGELIANDLKVKAADLIHKTHIFDADKLPVTETVYKAECYDDYCWQYEDKIQAPRKKYQDIPARTARMSGTDRLQINVSNDLKITGAIVESSAGSVHINAENSINISSSAWEEKTTSSHNHTQKWLFIPVKVSQTKESIIKQTLLRASISAHKELELKSRGRIMAKGTSLSGDHVDISSSAGNIDIESFYLTNFSTKESSRAGFLGMNRTGTITDTVEGVPIDTEILPRQKLALSAVSGNIRLDNAHFLLPLNQDESITGTNIAITAQKVIKVTQPHVSATETRAQ